MGTIAENKKTIDNFKDFNSSILTGMLANNPEIYSAFAKVLDQVEKKYFTGSQKQWTLDHFKNTKIIVDTPEKSIRLQGLLLDLGAEWLSDDVREEYKTKLVNHTDQKYLVINDKGIIYYLEQKHNWDSSGKEERFYHDIFPEETGTRQWTLEDFDNTKIILDTPEKSKRFQELLLSLGCEWIGLDVPDENLRKSVNLTDKKYLSIIAKNKFVVVASIEGFNRFSNKEIFYEEIFPEELTTTTIKDDLANYRVKTEEELIQNYGVKWKSMVNWASIGQMDWLFGKPLTEVVLSEYYKATLEKAKNNKVIHTSPDFDSKGEQWFLHPNAYKYDLKTETKKLVWRFKTKQELIDDGIFEKKLGIPEDDFNSFLGKPLSEIYAKERFKNLDEAIFELEYKHNIYLGKAQYVCNFDRFTQKPLPAEDKKQEPELTKDYYLNSKIMVANKNQSVNLQRFFNYIGISWFSDGSIIRYDNAKFLMVDENGLLGYTFDEVIFLQSKKKEILYKDILPFIKKTVLNPQKTEKQILLKHTETKPKIDDGFSLSIETDRAKLELPLWFEKNNGDRKAPTQSAGELKRWVTGKINELDYIDMILNTKFKGNDGNWYVINISKGSSIWTWRKA
jgi:hypothetical protein